MTVGPDLPCLGNRCLPRRIRLRTAALTVSSPRCSPWFLCPGADDVDVREVEREGRVIHVVAGHVENASHLLEDSVSAQQTFKSRDFH